MIVAAAEAVVQHRVYEGDLPEQAFRLRGLQLIYRLGFRLGQQAQRGVGRAGRPARM